VHLIVLAAVLRGTVQIHGPDSKNCMIKDSRAYAWGLPACNDFLATEPVLLKPRQGHATLFVHGHGRLSQRHEGAYSQT